MSWQVSDFTFTTLHDNDWSDDVIYELHEPTSNKYKQTSTMEGMAIHGHLILTIHVQIYVEISIELQTYSYKVLVLVYWIVSVCKI